ncbi:hypothetical protein CYLTODRAFT_485275 [Cylindrobasidium torrendii FP15055 ss-10]|uniref:Uncharacterized protein n=1 Tax=Cylindrobasidium torrendii FP15055 ss-10 TaxID=1314674 RepID=A0A0D7BTQ3_9AGAR|nr:hypothetical protein CYLTODRAFT_485275 [Cylindrobasidium torrendii FP15055 ss-10]
MAHVRRPAVERSDTEALLSYYGSNLADQGTFPKPVPVARSRRPSSSSSSAYSSSDSEYSTGSPPASPKANRRMASGSGAEVRRKLSIVPTAGTDVALVAAPDGSYKHNRSKSHATEEPEDIPKRPTLEPKRRSTGQSVTTPEVGQSKEIGKPVAAPVVVGTFSPQDPGSYINYRPGLHSTAGPLPTPPGLDREKRAQLEAVRQALQLPPSVEAVLARRTPSPHSDHVRQGAFAPTVVERSQFESTSSSPVVVRPPSPPLVTIIQPPPRNTSLPESSPPPPLPPSKKRFSGELSSSDSDRDEVSETPSPPPKSLRDSLTRGLKRMSLSRTSSLSSTSSSPPPAPYNRLGPPSTAHFAPSHRPPLHKIKTLYPAAMYCPELHPIPGSGAPKLNSIDRCKLYTQKINELYVHDCGLGDWLFEARDRSRSSPVSVGSPSVPSTRAFAPHPRNVSGGSEVTFPMRPDAAVATDLGPSSSAHSTPLNTPSAMVLPYPALPSRASPAQKTGFFASLGRRGSTSKKVVSPSSLASLPPLQPQHTPRAVLVKRPMATPSIPGGPRPPGGWKRMSRTQTISVAASRRGSETDWETSKSDHGHGGQSHGHGSLVAMMAPTSDTEGPGQRQPRAASSIPPALPPRTSSSSSNPKLGPDHERQLDKLAVLLPSADRAVLSGYLRRAGQDIIAIGQYLEDEKNGRLRRDI